MIVDRLGDTIFVEMSVEERNSIVKILRQHAANQSGFLGKVGTLRGAKAVARLEDKVQQIESLANCLEGGSNEQS